jgi:hypothetical protein
MSGLITKLIGVNWKTTGTGIASICTALGDITHSISTHTPINWNIDIPAIIAGIGLITAKDSTTHSTVAQVETSTAQVAAAKVGDPTAVAKP